MEQHITITEVTWDHIEFSNGQIIYYNHERDCCEHNYADFKQLEPLALSAVFNNYIIIEQAGDSGFRFGNPPDKMFFIPCYSEQNGWYSNELDIFCCLKNENFELQQILHLNNVDIY